MGQTAQTSNNGKATITVRVHNPQTPNHNTYSSYTTPELDHFDIIEGVVGGKVAPPATVPADGVSGYSDAYKCDTATAVKVIARFGKTASAADPNGIPTVVWTNEGNGYYSATIEVTLAPNQTKYYRLRGTNLAVNTANETDACGNPLPDTLMGKNTAAKAFADLWFYSNPIFVNNAFNSIQGANINDDVQLFPNPTNGSLTIHSGGSAIENIEIYDVYGRSIINCKLPIDNSIDISHLASGVYTVQIKTESGNVLKKKIVKQ
jgi:hypothetical protein